MQACWRQVSGDPLDYAAIARVLHQYMREIHYETGDPMIEVTCAHKLRILT